MGIFVEGREYSPKSIEYNEDTNQYTFAGKTWDANDEYFRYDMSADIRAEEAAAEAAVQRLMLGTATDAQKLADGFEMLGYDD